MSKKIRYGLSDVILDETIMPQKYAVIRDNNDNKVGYAEIYFIEEETEETEEEEE